LFAVERLFALAKGIGLFGFLHAPLDFVLHQSGILKQAQNLSPNEFVEIVLAQGPVLADRTMQVPPAIRTDTTVVVEYAMWFSSSGRAAERVAALLTYQQALQKRGPDGAPAGELLVLLQLLLSQSEGLL
jgi:hypothetical protein